MDDHDEWMKLDESMMISDDLSLGMFSQDSPPVSAGPKQSTPHRGSPARNGALRS